MSGHDPLCVQGPPDNPWCMCDLIARVRADERERIFSGVRWRRSVGDKSWSVECLTDRDAECSGCLCDCHVEAEVRERIAQEIERYCAGACGSVGEPCSCGPAARIARGGDQ